MVELCELNLGDRNLESQWPLDIDQHVAQLDFQRSSDEDELSLFSSMALDPSIISTDSLDMEKLHAQCEVNKNDYKLTFEDSGQWTSGGNLTTWGRIHSAEPLDEKTSSLPELGNGKRRPEPPETSVQRRPSSLLATFVVRQPSATTAAVAIAEQAEWYAGNGRYVDVNDNEVALVSNVTSTTTKKFSADRWRRAAEAACHQSAPAKPRRTFANFRNERAPQLDFMLMNHNMPSLCQSSASVDEILDRLKEGVLDDDKLDFSVLSVLEKRGVAPDSGLGSSAIASSGPVHIEDWPSLAILLPKHVAEACSFFKTNSRLLTGSNNIERAVTPRRAEACRTCFSIRRRLHPPIWAQPSSARHVLCDCTTSEIVDRGIISARDRQDSLGRLKLRAQELSIVGLPIYDSKRKLVERVVEGVAEVARSGANNNLFAALEALIADGLKLKHTWDMIVKLTTPGPATNSIHSLVKDLECSEKTLNSRVTTFFAGLLKLGTIDCWMCYVVLKESTLAAIYFDGAFMLRASTAYRSLLWRLLENLELLTLLERRSSPTETKSPISGMSSHQTASTSRVMLLGASQLASDSRVPKSSSMPSRLCASKSGRSIGNTQDRASIIKNNKSDNKRRNNSNNSNNNNNNDSSNDNNNMQRATRRLHSDFGGTTTQTLRRSRIPMLGTRWKRAQSNEVPALSSLPHDVTIIPVARRAYSTVSTSRCPIALAIADLDQPGMLRVSRGERLRILATRDQLSRCCRLQPRHDCVLQGLLPTRNLMIEQ